MSSPKSPRIAIVGAGPAGLLLARLLTQAKIQVNVFEREKDRTVRSQGGSLDLHDDTGLEAIQRAGLMDEFEKAARRDAEDFIIADRHGTRTISVQGEETGRPEIDRHKLRDILLDSVPEGVIRWNSNLRRAETGKLHFEHGLEDNFDLIIGAEGAWSKVRQLLTPVAPFYSGITWIEMGIANVDNKDLHVSKSIGRGSHFAWGEERGNACIGQRQGDGSVRISVMLRKPESWAKEHDSLLRDSAASRRLILDELSGWAPEYREWIDKADDGVQVRPLYMLPVGLTWPNCPGVTVVGDAAHLMTPFAGEGVNIALTDAMKLAEAIIDSPHDLTQAVKNYESWMFPASAKTTDDTWKSMLCQFDVDGARKMADLINAQTEEHT